MKIHSGLVDLGLWKKMGKFRIGEDGSFRFADIKQKHPPDPSLCPRLFVTSWLWKSYLRDVVVCRKLPLDLLQNNLKKAQIGEARQKANPKANQVVTGTCNGELIQKGQPLLVSPTIYKVLPHANLGRNLGKKHWRFMLWV